MICKSSNNPYHDGTSAFFVFFSKKNPHLNAVVWETSESFLDESSFFKGLGKIFKNLVTMAMQYDEVWSLLNLSRLNPSNNSINSRRIEFKFPWNEKYCHVAVFLLILVNEIAENNLNT